MRCPGRLARRLILTAGLVSLVGCSPIVHQRGVPPDPDRLGRLETGTTTASEVSSILGAPTAQALYTQDTWYYISQRYEQWAFFPIERTRQRVLRLRFDQDGVLQDMTELGPDDAREIARVRRTSPVQGRESRLLDEFLTGLGEATPTPAGTGTGAPTPGPGP